MALNHYLHVVRWAKWWLSVASSTNTIFVEQGKNSGSLLLDTDASQLGCGFFF